MKQDATTIWNIDAPAQFARALFSIDDEATLRAFLRDVMTEKEIIEISSRLEAARMLANGAKYVDIVAATKLSSTTVARISDWMQNGCGGYNAVLPTLNSHHDHILPARA